MKEFLPKAIIFFMLRCKGKLFFSNCIQNSVFPKVEILSLKRDKTASGEFIHVSSGHDALPIV
ncbi:hypothetical protein BGZ60DRAFT_407985, partial [Tricladium varicosporioides]